MAEISIVRKIYVRLSGLGLLYFFDAHPHCLNFSTPSVTSRNRPDTGQTSVRPTLLRWRHSILLVVVTLLGRNVTVSTATRNEMCSYCPGRSGEGGYYTRVVLPRTVLTAGRK